MTGFHLFFVAVMSAAVVARGEWEDPAFSRGDFPKDFVFGSGSSAYQVEGAAAEDGRTPSVWDTFCHDGKVSDKSTGDVAADGYHKYKEDIKLMMETGLEAYRFSISWTRILPNGRGRVNPLGVQYYNSFINELIKYGIQPHVTLFHYDHPQVLEDEYGGWLSPRIVDDFTAFADVCFKEFGDRVSYWTTLNEPNIFALGGYDVGLYPPARCSYPYGNCSKGNSVLEPYTVIHHSLLAHASAASLYRTRYQEEQHGYIGLNAFAYYFLPLTNSTRDKAAAQRAFDFYTGWVIEPLIHGDYPDNMKKNAGMKLSSFTPQQKEQLINSFDFLGINYYATLWAEDQTSGERVVEGDFRADISAKISVKIKGTPANKFIAYGLHLLLEHYKLHYGNPSVYIHENGYSMPHNTSLDDTPRAQYMHAHIASLLKAWRNGSNVRGYFTWSFLDLFELMTGYQTSYGLHYVNFTDKDLKRQPKISANWYSNFLKGHGIELNMSSDPSLAPIL